MKGGLGREGGANTDHSGNALPAVRPQCAHSAKFCMSAKTQILVLALFHKFVVPYLGFQSFLCIWDVPYFTCHPFSPIFRHFEPLELGLWILNPHSVMWPLECAPYFIKETHHANPC